MPKQLLRSLDVLVGLVVVGGMGGPEVVALDRLPVLLEESGEPHGQGVARVAGCTQWKHHIVV